MHRQPGLHRHAAARLDILEDEECLSRFHCVALAVVDMQREGDVRTVPILSEPLADAVLALPVRPASPLPPNVPTGPRNKNKYKDIDGSAPAVDGLDYGGGKDRTTPPDYDDRSSSR